MSEPKQRCASCACGQLSIRVGGDPVRVSSCCCQQCQRRTGGFYGVTAFFERGPGAGDRGRDQRVPPHRRQRRRHHLPLLPALRLERLVGPGGSPHPHQRRRRRLRRPGLPAARADGVDRTPASLGEDAGGAGGVRGESGVGRSSERRPSAGRDIFRDMKRAPLLIGLAAVAIIAIAPNAREDVGVPNIAIAAVGLAVILAAILWTRR